METVVTTGASEHPQMAAADQAVQSGRDREARRALEQAVLQTVQDAFRPTRAVSKQALELLFRPAARVAARRGVAFDRAVSSGAVDRAAAEILRAYVSTSQIVGPERPPAEGPIVLACNHAGLGDALATIAAAGRSDLCVMARRRGLLTALPGLADRLIEVEDARPSAALRAALRRLAAGRAVLLFPAGDIEPDPALDLDGAVASLARWSRSLDVIAARAPEAAILPVAVGGVVSRRALNAPPARWLDNARDSAFAAGTLQLLAPGFRDAEVRVSFGRPIVGAGRGASIEARAQMARLLRDVSDGADAASAGSVR